MRRHVRERDLLTMVINHLLNGMILQVVLKILLPHRHIWCPPESFAAWHILTWVESKVSRSALVMNGTKYAGYCFSCTQRRKVKRRMRVTNPLGWWEHGERDAEGHSKSDPTGKTLAFWVLPFLCRSSDLAIKRKTRNIKDEDEA